MAEITASANVLDRGQVAAFVVHCGQPIARELLRDVRDAIAVCQSARLLASEIRDTMSVITILWAAHQFRM